MIEIEGIEVIDKIPLREYTVLSNIIAIIGIFIFSLSIIVLVFFYFNKKITIVTWSSFIFSILLIVFSTFPFDYNLHTVDYEYKCKFIESRKYDKNMVERELLKKYYIIEYCGNDVYCVKERR